MSKTILILGGGAGGLAAACELRKKIPQEHRIILIDQNDFQFFYPSLLWVLEGTRTPKQIIKSFDGLKRKGIEFYRGKVDKIDLSEKSVSAGGTLHRYDYLIVALGAELDYKAVPGASAENCLFVLPGIQITREKLNSFLGGNVFVVIASTPFRCPAAPYEAAMILNDLFKKNGIREKIDLRIYTSEEQPMPVAGPKIGAAVRGMLENQKIKYFPKVKLNRIDNQNNEIILDNAEKYHFDLLLVVPPHKAPEVVKASGLTGESGWIPVDPATLETKFPGVFAIGDITGIKLSNGKPLPKAGVFAHFEAEVVASRIAAEIKGQAPHKKFSGWGQCFLEVGNGKAGLAFGDFYAKPDPKVIMLPPMRIWHWVKILFEKWWFWKWF